MCLWFRSNCIPVIATGTKFLSVQAFEEIGLNERFVTDLESAASNLKESRNQIHAVR